MINRYCTPCRDCITWALVVWLSQRRHFPRGYSFNTPYADKKQSHFEFRQNVWRATTNVFMETSLLQCRCHRQGVLKRGRSTAGNCCCDCGEGVLSLRTLEEKEAAEDEDEDGAAHHDNCDCLAALFVRRVVVNVLHRRQSPLSGCD